VRVAWQAPPARLSPSLRGVPPAQAEGVHEARCTKSARQQEVRIRGRVLMRQIAEIASAGERA